MSAEVIRGYLYVEDEKGSYRIPAGRRSRRCLAVLEKKEGEFVRSLEIDLFTGFVYYCVDNATSGGLSYYYDMSSKKVGHYFIHRYLRMAKNHGFTASPLEMEILEKLPCEDWKQQLERLPGWKEAIENRIKNLLLPEDEPLRISIPRSDGRPLNISSISFILSPAAYPARRPEKIFLFENGKIRHQDETVGTEFLGEDEEYERILSPAESDLIKGMIGCVSGGGQDFEDLETGILRFLPEDIIKKLLPQKDDLVMREACVRNSEGTGPRLSESGPLWMLYALLRGLIRREIEVVYL